MITQRAVRMETVASFLESLTELGKKQDWHAVVNNHVIQLRLDGLDAIFSPLTAVYFALTGKILHPGSFWHSQISEELGLPWWEVNRISYAEIACGYGNRCDWALRDQMLEALDLHKERSNWYVELPTTVTLTA